MSTHSPTIKAPATPLPQTYQPAGSTPYKVCDHDSWFNLAKARQVDPWWLIQYNFETRNPSEVNWYLQNRTGCKKTTVDGRNFRFSSADSPGIIFLPLNLEATGLRSLAFKGYGITIEGDDDYQNAVETVLARIAASDTGMALLDGIRRTGKPLLISAFTGTVCNAYASETSLPDATPANDYALDTKGNQVKDPSFIRDLLGLPLDPVVGTGKGSGTELKFTASMWGFGSTGLCAPYAGAPGASPSQVLFHEMAHAYRMMRGKFRPRATIGSSVVYDNMEEFFAIVLSNVLTSDPTYSTGNRTLRADHWGFQPLAPNLCTSKGFVSSIPNRNKMRELVADDPALVAALKKVKSYFNPFAEPL